MEEIAFSRFRAKCSAVLERVRKTGQPLLVTRFGVPVAQVVPALVPQKTSTWLGSGRGTGRILADIVSPASDEGEWEVLAD
jgi:prevent-host-death family protein